MYGGVECEKIEESEIVEAARAANAHDFLRRYRTATTRSHVLWRQMGAVVRWAKTEDCDSSCSFEEPVGVAS